jgi:predicted amino acid-binding ACT domain protein
MGAAMMSMGTNYNEDPASPMNLEEQSRAAAAGVHPVDSDHAAEIILQQVRGRIDDKPGTLAAITTILGRLGANILEVEHKRMFLDVPAKGASVDVMVETRDGAHAERVAQALSEEGFQPRRIPAGGA